MVNRSAFHTISYGLYVVTARTANGKKVGCTANTFQQVTSSPFQVSITLNKENATEAAIEESGHFCVSVLDQDCPMELIGLFGFKSSNDVDKFADTKHALTASEIPYVQQNALAWFSAKVVNKVDLGTHVMFIGEVDEADVLGEGEPLTYAYYHAVKRGKTPPKASSFVPEDAAESAPAQESAPDEGKRYGWRCTVCGYIVEDYPDGLPADFTCPICGVGPEMFERIEL